MQGSDDRPGPGAAASAENARAKALVRNSVVLAAGLVALIAASAGMAVGSWRALGAVLGAVAAAALCGALLGFLFGIPRSLTTAAPSDKSAGDGRNGSFTHNTNLEQISDWLTKIVVGLGLVQAQTLSLRFEALAARVAVEWGLRDGQATAGFVLLSSLLFGFLAAYIWTRTVFVYYLEYNETVVAAERHRRVMAERKAEDAERRANDAMERADKAQEKQLTLSRAVNFLAGGDRDDDAARTFAEPGKISDAEQRLWDSDPNKGAFGGSPEAGGKRLSVEAVPLDEARATYAVRIMVRSVDPGKPLRGSVTFHLHPTFKPVDSRKIAAVDGVAEWRVVAGGAFTIGAETEDGTRLELDLADLDEFSQTFRDA